MFSFYAQALELIRGRGKIPGWIKLVDANGTSVLARNIRMKDNSVKCLTLCGGYAMIYSCPYEKNTGFLKKPQYCILALDEQSFGLYMNQAEVREVLGVCERLQMNSGK